ncbi:hypothetical protein CEP54_002508 [Fusarium duplospermum]|uniref:2EXR domain-containing protein n=1 Tax=Fusarium duplospermum TaxID=1325734 RepID=A0A428QUH2_9HYPO|nr:hypothetical protein CEP54_002508 [Fusarium duplospermum]
MPTPAPEDSTVGATPAQTFHPFPRLPFELRQEIWKHALPLTPEKPGVCLFTETITLWADIGKLTVEEYNSSLKLVCHEARQTAIKNLPVRRFYDPLTDILYFENDLFFPFTSRASTEALNRIKRIALGISVTEFGFSMSLGLFQLKGLEELSIVYPKSTGRADFFDEVYAPETGPRKLKRFTEDEMSNFVMRADFIYRDHGGDVPVRWIKNARMHLDYVRRELSRETHDGRPPCWDEEKQKLMLTMHALCFDQEVGLNYG